MIIKKYASKVKNISFILLSFEQIIISVYLLSSLFYRPVILYIYSRHQKNNNNQQISDAIAFIFTFYSFSEIIGFGTLVFIIFSMLTNLYESKIKNIEINYIDTKFIDVEKNIEINYIDTKFIDVEKNT